MSLFATPRDRGDENDMPMPDMDEAKLEKAMNAFHWRGSPGEALAIIDRTPRDDNVDVIQSRTYYLMLARDYDAAAAALATISPSEFDRPTGLLDYYGLVVQLAMARGDVETARTAATAGQALALAAVAEQPRIGFVHVGLAIFEAQLGHREAALDYLRIGMKLGRDDRFFFCGAITIAPTVHLALGDCGAAIDLLAETLDSGGFWRLQRNALRLDQIGREHL